MALDENGVPQALADLTQTSDWYAAPDITLLRMADWANRGSGGIAITLIVPGGLVSGLVTSMQDFLRSTSNELRNFATAPEGQGDELANDFRTMLFDEPAQLIDEQLKEQDEAVKRGDPTASAEITNYTLMLRHLHLRDAYFTAPGQKSISLGHTRVLLTQVAAWSVGARTVSRA